MMKLLSHAPVDGAADQLGKRFIHDTLPPVFTEGLYSFQYSTCRVDVYFYIEMVETQCSFTPNYFSWKTEKYSWKWRTLVCKRSASTRSGGDRSGYTNKANQKRCCKVRGLSVYCRRTSAEWSQVCLIAKYVSIFRTQFRLPRCSFIHLPSHACIPLNSPFERHSCFARHPADVPIVHYHPHVQIGNTRCNTSLDIRVTGARN